MTVKERGMAFNNITLKSLSSGLSSIPLYKDVKSGDVLKAIDFFSELDNTLLEEIASSIMISEFPENYIISRHGKLDERFYIILSGLVRAVIPTDENPRFEMYRLKAGDFFGEEIVYSTEPRRNTFIAAEHTVAISMGADILKKLINKSDRIRSGLDQKYIERKLENDLRKVPILTELNDSLFKEILNTVELFPAKKGKIIFSEGDRGDSFYLIRDGEISISRILNNSKHLLALFGEGQFFGEMALLSDEKRNATAEVVEDSNLVKLTRDSFLEIIGKDERMRRELQDIIEVRKRDREDILKNPNTAVINRKLLDLNKVIYKHLDILSQCMVDTGIGSALLATLPGSRYPYVYPRDSACASRFLYQLVISPIKAGDIAFRYLGEIAGFILNCQREDGYWGQRYGINGEDKGIYTQEDNVAHGVIILCRYLLAAMFKGVEIPFADRIIDAIARGARYARKNYYRNEIHLFYSTTSIHESAIERGYSIWVNYSYLLMLRLLERVKNEYGLNDRFRKEMDLKAGFQTTIDNIFELSERYVRRLNPDGTADLRPDITLLSPFFFGTGMDIDYFKNNQKFRNSISFIEESLWDPDLGMLQRYLPFIEDPDTHIHAGNGPWVQYTAMLAQYYYYTGNIGRGDEIIDIINKYQSKEGYLCEHLTLPERFYEFQKFEWLTGADFDKEFAPDILLKGITHDLIVEELNHMKNSYDEVEKKCKEHGDGRFIAFATPLMWSHAEYAMAVLMKNNKELETLELKRPE